MSTEKIYDLIGIGVGPFNLSLAAHSSQVNKLDSLFLEQKPSFEWHRELIFQDSYMQTSFLKDLVTGSDPTNPYTFLNYLVKNGLFYSFMNTGRKSITRKEFEVYCRWVADSLGDNIAFGNKVKNITQKNNLFIIETNKAVFTAKNICLGTGLIPSVPKCAREFIGKDVFHAKSKELASVNLEGKNLVVVGGGQTGVEVFKNALNEKWGRPNSIKLITTRANLEPLESSPFTDEYFTPGYVKQFFSLKNEKKESIVNYQLLASDGNTPEYLEELYNELYLVKNIHKDERKIEILPYRWLDKVEKSGESYNLTYRNDFRDKLESDNADVVILATGFQKSTPPILDLLEEHIPLCEKGRFIFNKDYSLKWDGEKTNKIFAFNFSRYGHGISEPQLSLMAWRSANVINALCEEEIFPTTSFKPNFIDYGEE